MRGLERLVAAGGDPSRVLSVASFFVSRVDSEADKRLEAVGRPDLQGKLAIANAKLAYQHYLADVRRRALGLPGGKGRASPALPVGVDLDEESRLPRRALRRGADRAGYRQHDAARDGARLPGSRRDPRRDAYWRASARRSSCSPISTAAGVDYDDVVETLEAEGVQKFADSFARAARGDCREVGCLDGGVTDPPNPLAEGLQLRRRPEPCAAVIFGASGDLTKRKLIPALYALAYRKLLPEQFAVLGVARTPQSSKAFASAMKKAVKDFARDPFRQDVWDTLAAGMRYVATEFDDDAGEDRVGQALEELDAERGTQGNRLYYLAVPPQAFAITVTEIGERRAKEGWVRLIVEKPFGHDLASARELNELLHRWFTEDEIFRIDHYLGKETVQNMLVLRFANGIFEPIWNRQFIDHVQITVAESMGIEGRAGFYESAGAIRDIFQNHLLQLLALTAMEPPIDFTADSVRNEKVKVLKAMHTPGPKSVVRGQYGRGFVEGVEVPRLPGGAGCRARVADGDVRRGEAVRRQLALGGHPVLRSRRQASRTPGDDDRDPVPAGTASAVRGDRRRRPAAERAPDPRPARRRCLARDRREGARGGDDDPHRAHGLPLWRRLPHRAARSVRAPDPGRDAGRCDAVHA